jgi:hypothetical protein
VADIIAKLDAENEKKRQARKRVVPKNKIARELGKKTGVLVTREGAVIADERAAAIARARRANPKMVRDADQKRRESRAINEALGIKGKKKPVKVVDSPYML